jgi:hypothetical protein
MSAYRDDVEALNARHEALATEVAQKTKELADAARLLDDARTAAARPVLDNIRVATPCSADWAKMSGDERVRACADCNKNVFNISNLTREEAQALIIEKNGKLCVRFYQRHDGTILLKDCSIGLARKRRRRVIAAGAAALLAGIGGWIVLTKRAEPESHCMNPQLPEQAAANGVRVTGHESVPMPHHEYEAKMGDYVE